jgi:hypothetical protein
VPPGYSGSVGCLPAAIIGGRSADQNDLSRAMELRPCAEIRASHDRYCKASSLPSCCSSEIRASLWRQAPDQTARTSPVGALRSPRSDRPHPGRPLACRGRAAAPASWQRTPESGLSGLPRRRRLARAADSGQGPHLDPRPSGSAAAGARARSLWLPPSASRHDAHMRSEAAAAHASRRKVRGNLEGPDSRARA